LLSTHPSGPTRIHDIEVNLPKVAPLYARAERPARRFAAPKPSDAKAQGTRTDAAGDGN
jgi:hypothetical protein